MQTGLENRKLHLLMKLVQIDSQSCFPIKKLIIALTSAPPI